MSSMIEFQFQQMKYADLAIKMLGTDRISVYDEALKKHITSLDEVYDEKYLVRLEVSKVVDQLKENIRAGKPVQVNHSHAFDAVSPWYTMVGVLYEGQEIVGFRLYDWLLDVACDYTATSVAARLQERSVRVTNLDYLTDITGSSLRCTQGDFDDYTKLDSSGQPIDDYRPLTLLSDEFYVDYKGVLVRFPHSVSLLPQGVSNLRIAVILNKNVKVQENLIPAEIDEEAQKTFVRQNYSRDRVLSEGTIYKFRFRNQYYAEDYKNLFTNKDIAFYTPCTVYFKGRFVQCAIGGIGSSYRYGWLVTQYLIAASSKEPFYLYEGRTAPVRICDNKGAVVTLEHDLGRHITVDERTQCFRTSPTECEPYVDTFPFDAITTCYPGAEEGNRAMYSAPSARPFSIWDTDLPFALLHMWAGVDKFKALSVLADNPEFVHLDCTPRSRGAGGNETSRISVYGTEPYYGVYPESYFGYVFKDLHNIQATQVFQGSVISLYYVHVQDKLNIRCYLKGVAPSIEIVGNIKDSVQSLEFYGDDVEMLMPDVCKDLKGLRRVLLPPNLIEIGSNAFRNTRITEITLPATLQRLDNYCFAGCEKLTDIELPEGLKIIGASAFAGCVSLRRLTIPASVKIIHQNAFKDCISLANLRIKGTPYIANDAFSGCSANVENIASQFNVFDPFSRSKDVTALYNIRW